MYVLDYKIEEGEGSNIEILQSLRSYNGRV